MQEEAGSIRKKQMNMVFLLIFLTYICVWLIPFLKDFTGKAPGTVHAESILRDITQFKWYIIFMFLVVLNIYTDEIRSRNWSCVMAGLGFMVIETFNEIWNGLFHTAVGGYSGVWMCAYPTGYEVLIGWNIEIIFMFFILGISGTKLLPEDKNMLFFGRINNRIVFAVVLAILSVIVEIVLNQCGALVWNYPWWSSSFPWLIFLIGYLPFWMVAFYVYDLPTIKDQIRFVSVSGGAVAILFVSCVSLGWI